MKKLFFAVALFTGLFLQAQKTEIEIKNNWQYTQAGMGSWLPATVPGCIHTDLLDNKVINDPFYRTNERELQWIDKLNWEYKTVFDVNNDMFSKQNIALVFQGLDTYADVYLNDSLVLKANNMFRVWNVDCKKMIKQKGNILRIYFYSPILIGLQALEKNGYQLPAVNDQSENGGMGRVAVSVFLRKAPYSFGWDWGPRFVTSGIWKPVSVQAWNDALIDDLYIIQSEINEKVARLKAKTELRANNDGKFILQISCNGKVLKEKEIALAKGTQSADIDFEIANPQLWWSNGLGKQNLSEFKAELLDNAKVIDSKSVVTGLRKIEVVQDPDPDGKGKSFYFRINGKAIFAKGANYIPNDIFLTRVTPADYEKVIKSAADANMNMLRLWGGGVYEYDIFYNLCDKYGILVWHDFMFACSMYPGGDDFFNNVKQEAIDNVKRIRNHPCIALWCGNNEIETAWGEGNENHGWGWKQKYSKEQRIEIWNNYQKVFADILPNVIKENAIGAFYWPSSPTAGDGLASYDSRSGDMHYWGVWHGKHPFSDFNKYSARFMSEYGFQSFPEFKTVQTYTKPDDYNIESDVMAAHQRAGNGNLKIKEYMIDWYRDPKDFQSFLYVSQLLQAEGIKSAIYAHRRNMPYTMGTLFWQINDCWPVASWSSIDYYKRWKALQYYAKKAYKEVVVMPYLENDKVKIFLASDRQGSFKAKLKISLFTFEGKKLSEKIIPVTIEVNKGILAYNTEEKEILGSNKPEETYLFAELLENEKVISDDALYFKNPKDLNLQKAEIIKEITVKDGKTVVKLVSNKLVKNVFLSLPNSDAFFSDNYFDIFPGKPLTITLDGVNVGINIEKELQIGSLVDTY